MASFPFTFPWLCFLYFYILLLLMPVSGSVLLYAGAHKISLKYLFPEKMFIEICCQKCQKCNTICVTSWQPFSQSPIHSCRSLAISNVNNLCHQEAWNWGRIFKRTDDHIFEKTLKIELSPIPQAYTLKLLKKARLCYILIISKSLTYEINILIPNVAEKNILILMEEK
jgi:hypothetical protein